MKSLGTLSTKKNFAKVNTLLYYKRVIKNSELQFAVGVLIGNTRISGLIFESVVGGTTTFFMLSNIKIKIF